MIYAHANFSSGKASPIRSLVEVVVVVEEVVVVFTREKEEVLGGEGAHSGFTVY